MFPNISSILSKLPKRKVVSILYRNRIRTKKGFFSGISQLDILVNFLKGHLDFLRKDNGDFLSVLRKRFKYRGSSFSGLLRKILIEIFPTDLDEPTLAREKCGMIYDRIITSGEGLDSFVMKYLLDLKDSVNSVTAVSDDSDKENLIWEE